MSPIGVFDAARTAVRMIGRAAKVQAYEVALMASVAAMAPLHLVGGGFDPAWGPRSPVQAHTAPTTRPVLLVHGFGGTKSSWSLLAQALSARGLTVDAITYTPIGTSGADVEPGLDAVKVAQSRIDAFAARSTVVGQEFVRDPVALGQVATGLLNVLPTKQHTSAEYAYLAQTTRTNAAAVVAEGAGKPTSVYSVTRVEQSLVVVAHLSEGIPRFWLLDNSALETFVESASVRPAGGRREQGVDRRQRHQRDPGAGVCDLGAGHPAQGPDQAGDSGLRGWRHRAAPPKPGLHYAVLDASDDVVRLAECREPLTAQARARIN